MDYKYENYLIYSIKHLLYNQAPEKYLVIKKEIKMEEYFIPGILCSTIVLWFWAILDITRSKFKKPTMRTVILIIVLVIPTLGSIIYLLIRKNITTKERRKFKPKF